ncbi:MAG TPA: sigma factor-like helix-turn-helix DNA-binding protein, partial [Opitutaceae bacterium]|nr:sigma factor-like helix-turn-helix DNA-binding protein [Opitutaceae bacterium]
AWTEAGGFAVASGADASGQAETAERAEAVRAAVAELPLELREALVLCVYEGLAQADAAAALGTTVKTVEMRLYRARARLRERLSWLGR